LTGGLITATGTITGANLILTTGTIDGPAAGRITINGSDIDTDFAVDGDTLANVLYVDAGTGTASFGTSTQVTNAIVNFAVTNSIKVPVGNTVQRPSTGVTGMLRFNTTTNALEIFDNTQYVSVGSPVFTVIDDEQFNGDGSTVAFTLGSTQTTNSCIVSINGVVQVPISAYSVAGTDPTCVLTFTEAPISGDLIDVRQITTTSSVTSISNSPGNAVVAVNATVGNVEITGNIMPTANATANIGSASFQYNTIFAQATSAQYADLAEKYTADAAYAPGTVIAFGGTHEVTLSTQDADRRVAGVVSTNPSYIMNGGLEGANIATVALTGRVPTSVREYLVEVRGLSAGWITHPRRMLRHKAMVQCARLTFGLIGIYDADEAMSKAAALQQGAVGFEPDLNPTRVRAKSRKRFPKGVTELKQSLNNFC
jgi:hypothetical protein